MAASIVDCHQFANHTNSPATKEARFQKKMGASFLSDQLFRRDCCSPVHAERSRRSCQRSEEALGALRQRTGLPPSELPPVVTREKLKCGRHICDWRTAA